MKRLADPLTSLTGREAVSPNATMEASPGEFTIKRGNRSGLPGGQLPLFLVSYGNNLPEPNTGRKTIEV